MQYLSTFWNPYLGIVTKLYGTLCTLCYNSGISLELTTTCIHAYAFIYTSYSPPLSSFISSDSCQAPSLFFSFCPAPTPPTYSSLVVVVTTVFKQGSCTHIGRRLFTSATMATYQRLHYQRPWLRLLYQQWPACSFSGSPSLLHD